MAMQGSITGYAQRGFACLPHEAILFADMWRYIFPQPSPHDLSGRIRSEYAPLDERRAPWYASGNTESYQGGIEHIHPVFIELESEEAWEIREIMAEINRRELER